MLLVHLARFLLADCVQYGRPEEKVANYTKIQSQLEESKDPYGTHPHGSGRVQLRNMTLTTRQCEQQQSV